MADDLNKRSLDAGFMPSLSEGVRGRISHTGSQPHPWPVSHQEQPKLLLLKYQDASEGETHFVGKVGFTWGGVLLLLQPRKLEIHPAVVRQLCKEQGKREN